MPTWLRRLVSTNKRRWQADGWDLDLSYVVDGRVIAMGAPCNTWLRSAARNPLRDVAAFLAARHRPGTLRVYNLCIEPGWQYPHDLLLPGAGPGCVMELPLWDAQAPPCHLLRQFCDDAAAWLAADPSHAVVVHCKAGKGRTGALVAALLIHLAVAVPEAVPELGAALCGDAPYAATLAPAPAPAPAPAALPLVLPALDYWAQKRTVDGKGLTISSQRRYVSYYAALLDAGWHAAPPTSVAVQLVEVSGLSVPTSPGCATLPTSGGADPPAWTAPKLTLVVWVRPPGEHTPHVLVFGWTRAPAAKEAFLPVTIDDSSGMLRMRLPDHVVKEGVVGDIKVQVLDGWRLPSHPAVFKGRASLFYAWLSTAFLATHDQHALAGTRPGWPTPPLAPPHTVANGTGSGQTTDATAPPAACVTLHAGELDKLQKRLRGLKAVQLRLHYSTHT